MPFNSPSALSEMRKCTIRESRFGEERRRRTGADMNRRILDSSNEERSACGLDRDRDRIRDEDDSSQHSFKP